MSVKGDAGMTEQVSVIIVTHNAEKHLDHCYRAIEAQSIKPAEVIIVDSGSSDKSYLGPYKKKENCLVTEIENIGYGPANNIGLSLIHEQSSFVVILNPDTFLEKNFISKALDIAQKNKNYAIITGTLSGYSITDNEATGRIDSTGIYRKWYGRWYDRGQGKSINTFELPEASSVPAVCGALMFCRMDALKSELPQVFDENFFLYKEDIELCLRIRKKGWNLHYSPDLDAYHCRGWGERRSDIKRSLKIISSLNEIKMYKKHGSPYIGWALAKYILVKLFNI